MSAAPILLTRAALPAGWLAMPPTGCLIDNAYNGNPRTLGDRLGAGFTVEACLSAAQAQGYTLAGLEYYGECWADTTFRNVTNMDTLATDCFAPCDADKTETCGAGWRLSAYMFNSIALSPSSSTVVSTTSAIGTSSSVSISTTATATATSTSVPTTTSSSGWFTLDSGCLLDAVNGQPRTFSNFLGGDAT
ncbi:hypothetical protein HDU76_008144, partial [Blyttiomyces sp. JEL0837]